jgi:hypothetical protein
MLVDERKALELHEQNRQTLLEQHARILCKAVENLLLVMRCKSKVVAFDYLRENSELVEEEYARLEKHHVARLKKNTWRQFMLAVKISKEKQKQSWRALNLKKRHDLKKLRVMLHRIRVVLHGEAEWLNQARYEVLVRAREDALTAWKLFVKGRKIKQSHRFTVYSLFMLELQKRVEKNRLNRIRAELKLAS